MRIKLLDIQRGQHFTAFLPRRYRQLMLGQMRQLAVQSVMTARPQPLCGVLAITVLWPQIQLDRQFQVVHAIAVAQQHVQLAEGVTGTADGQVGGQQLHARRMLHRKLPQAFVIQTQATRARQAQPLLQGAAVPVQLAQPAFQQMRRLHPVAAGQRVALRPRRLREHRRGEHDPRQVAHLGVAQLAGQVVQVGEHSHGPSIAF